MKWTSLLLIQWGLRKAAAANGAFFATPTSARNAPARLREIMRARVVVLSGLFCVRDDPAEIAGCQLRRFGMSAGSSPPSENPREI